MSPTSSSLRLAILGMALVATSLPAVLAHNTGGTVLGSANTDGSDPLPGTAGKVVATGSIGLAFGLTALAAGCSMLGSFLPYLDVIIPRYTRYKDFRISESRGFLAASISFAAGVLLFLTLSDLFPEAGENWSDSSAASAQSGGIIAWAWMAGTLIAILVGKHLWRRYRGNAKAKANTEKPSGVSSATATATDLATLPTHDISTGDVKHAPTALDAEAIRAVEIHGHNPHFRVHDSDEFRSLGIQIAVALAIHNFPEGLSTFAATLTSQRIGVLYGIALALHKIPEGMMIALPIYLATGSRLKAFLIASAIGITAQMLGAVLGYALFVTYWNSAVSGTLFAVATGILVHTIFASMLPLARRYDEADKYTSQWLFTGLIFFSLVNALFTLGTPVAAS